MREPFRERYGPYVIILGGTHGIGRAFSDACAARGLAPVVVARVEDAPREVASALATRFGVDARAVEVDLAAPDAIERVARETEGLDVGLVVYVAALSLVGPFEAQRRDEKLRALRVNCEGPLRTADAFLPRLVARGRGGLVLLSSASAFQGTGWVATYAATKAFNTVLGEGLWWEYRDRGVDVLALEPGRTETPTYRAQRPKESATWIAPVQTAEEVAREGLDALGRVPSHVCGGRGRWSTLALRRLLPRRALVSLYGTSTRAMFDEG